VISGQECLAGLLEAVAWERIENDGKEERLFHWIMKQALSAWVAQEEERDRLTQEALADVDAGRVIDHQAVQAWADSLDTDQPLPLPR